MHFTFLFRIFQIDLILLCFQHKKFNSYTHSESEIRTTVITIRKYHLFLSSSYHYCDDIKITKSVSHVHYNQSLAGQLSFAGIQSTVMWKDRWEKISRVKGTPVISICKFAFITSSLSGEINGLNMWFPKLSKIRKAGCKLKWLLLVGVLWTMYKKWTCNEKTCSVR